jgi:hypothetical protein
VLDGDAPELEEALQAFTMNLLSYHDVQARKDEAGGGPVSPRLRTEQVLQAFVIGLLATLEPEYEVRSNRESGLGRPDVMIRPRRPGKPGVVLELKIAGRGKKPKAALREGLTQIRENAYVAEFAAAGASPVHAVAAAVAVAVAAAVGVAVGVALSAGGLTDRFHVPVAPGGQNSSFPL